MPFPIKGPQSFRGQGVLWVSMVEKLCDEAWDCLSQPQLLPSCLQGSHELNAENRIEQGTGPLKIILVVPHFHQPWCGHQEMWCLTKQL